MAPSSPRNPYENSGGSFELQELNQFSGEINNSLTQHELRGKTCRVAPLGQYFPGSCHCHHAFPA
jgi:hypothetical protein